MKTSTAFLIVPALALAAGAAHADVSLGSYHFASDAFGNSLVESDGGAYSSRNWLNTTNVDPGNPAYLTGANFNTGIANIGLSGSPVYTITYNNGIANGSGADLGIVTGRYSLSDTISLAVSTDGVNFTSAIAYGPSLGVDSGVSASYYYGGAGPYGAELFVTSIDLSDFGLAQGSTIEAAQITGSPELDLIRVAGFASSVPEPGSTATLLAGLGLLGAALRRRQRA